MGVLVFFGEGRVADVRVRGGDVAVREQGVATSFLELVGTGRVPLRVVCLLGGTITRDTGFPGKPVAGVFFLDSGVYAFRRVLVAAGSVLVAGIRIVVRGGSFHEAVVRRAGTGCVLPRGGWRVAGVGGGDGTRLCR